MNDLHIKIQDVLRAGHIKRWNIVNTSRQQTLAEHLFNVTMIARSIVDEMNFCDNEEIMLKVTEWALVHDVPEVVCGDTPTPTKQRIKDFGFDMELIYEAIDPEYKKARSKAIAEGYYAIVKIADMIEALWFLKENGVGKHSMNVYNGILNRFKSFMVELNSVSLRDAANKVVQRINSGNFYE